MACGCGKVNRGLPLNYNKHDHVFYLSCHFKLKELLIHKDILKCYPHPHKVHVFYSGDEDDAVGEHVRMPRLRDPSHAPAVFLLSALEHARKNNYMYICLNNGDDWCLNFDHVRHCFEKLTLYHAVGYDWCGEGTIALNQLYLNVAHMWKIRTESFLRHYESCTTPEYQEQAIGNILRKASMYHLADREHPDGIGRKTELEGDNTRWFNRQMKLLCHHCWDYRWKDFQTLQIPELSCLLQQANFSKWYQSNQFLTMIS